MRKMTPEQRAAAIACITAVVEAKRAEDAAAADTAAEVAKVKTAKRRTACSEYSKRWHAKRKAEHEADPALRKAYLEQMRIKWRASYRRKKERT